VLKGPAIAGWLYDPHEARAYGDTDLLVAPDGHGAAVELLQRLGFASEMGPLAHPRMESGGSEPWVRAAEHVDLHVTLQGLAAPAPVVWAALSRATVSITVDAAEVRVLAPAARLLHVVLHAAQHQEAKPVRDLERALERLPFALWQEAAALAGELHGRAAFASGLGTLPAGVARRAELGADAVSVETLLRQRGVPLAEGIHDLRGVQQPVRVLLRELFPSVAFMRWWAPLARRGRRGLAAAYVWRLAWLALNLPRALVALAGARRAARR
jgi:hypothetical protein